MQQEGNTQMENDKKESSKVDEGASKGQLAEAQAKLEKVAEKVGHRLQENAQKVGHAALEAAGKAVHSAQETAQEVGHRVKEAASTVLHRRDELASKTPDKPKSE
jgi:hypothetical protein